MHFILGILGFIVTVVILVKRLSDAGIRVADLNPFLWKRRNEWRKQYDGDPVFKVHKPMDATAIIMVAVAKADGDITSESKNKILELFKSEFSLSNQDASGLMVSSSHLLGDGKDVREKLDKFLKPSKENFTESQLESALTMIESAAKSNDGSIHPSTSDFLEQVRKEFAEMAKPPGKWE